MADQKSITGGVLGAAISPRRSREHSIDLSSSLELLDFLYEGGVDGIALLGSTGEFVHFMLEDRARMLDFAVKRSRLPILVNVSHSTLDGAIFLAEEAANSGVAAVLLMPPYYFRYDQEAIRSFFLKFAETINKQIPVYLYNIPVFSNAFEIETARGLLATGAFAGIKDSSGDPTFMQALLEDRPCQVFNGDDRRFVKARTAGADGGISGVACAVPELMVALNQAIVAGDHPRIERLDTLLQEFLDWVERFPTPVAIKEAAKQRGVHAGVHAGILGEHASQELTLFSSWFETWLPGVLKECRSAHD